MKQSEHQREITEKIADWFANGHVGASSKAMAVTALGATINATPAAHPLDPSDFNRCLLLLECVPEIRERFAQIGALSPQWKAVVDHWEELTALFVAEVGWNWSNALSAPKTYQRMKELGL